MTVSKIKNNQPIINNGGTVTNGGAVSSGPINNAVSLNQISKQDGYGSQVKERVPTDLQFTDTPGVTKALDNGTFAYKPEKGTNYIIAGAGENANKINNTVANSLLTTGGVTGKTIHSTTSTRRIGSYNTSQINVLSPLSSGVNSFRTKGDSAGEESVFVSTSGNFPAVDNASNLSYTFRGRVTYNIGVPVYEDYSVDSVMAEETTTTTTTTEAPTTTTEAPTTTTEAP